MPATIPVTASDIAYSNIQNALIVKAEFKGTSENVSSFVDMGPLKEAVEISFVPKTCKLVGGREFPTIYSVESKFVIMCSGTNMLAAINTFLSNAVDSRLTDINGKKYTLSSTQAIPAAGLELKGGESGEPVQYPVTIKGMITATQLAAAIA